MPGKIPTQFIDQLLSRVDIVDIVNKRVPLKKAGKEYDTVTSVDAVVFKKAMKDKDTLVFDVRKEGEYGAAHLENAENTPLDFINDHLAEFPSDKLFYLHCAGGYRSMIAASILKSRGIHNLIDVAGGFKAIKEAGIPVTDAVCPGTLR